MLWYNQSFAQICLFIGTVSRVSDMAHGPLVFWFCFVITFFLFLKFQRDGGSFIPSSSNTPTHYPFINNILLCRTHNLPMHADPFLFTCRYLIQGVYMVMVMTLKYGRLEVNFTCLLLLIALFVITYYLLIVRSCSLTFYK